MSDQSRKTSARRGAALVGGLLAVAVAAPASAECVFAKLGEMKVESRTSGLLVDIEVGGVKKKMALNSDASFSALTAAGAASLGVAPGFDDARIVSAKGDAIYRSGELKNVVVGDAFVIPSLNVKLGAASSADPEIVGFLGQDILGAADVEFDLAHNRIAFYQPKGCEKLDLIYWSQSFSLAPLRKRDFGQHFRTEIEVNGRSLDAIVSTTIPYSVLDKAAARAAGVTPETAGVTALPKVRPSASEAWIGTFVQVAIGDEQVKNVKLVFSDLWADAKVSQTGRRLGVPVAGFPSVMLGLDFLRAHRVLLSTSQGRMYLTYNGGGVFRTPNPTNTPPPG